MNRYNVILAAVATTVVVGCATAPNSQVAESQADKSYRTGSRLPVHDSSASADVKGITDKQTIDQMMRRMPDSGPPKVGH